MSVKKLFFLIVVTGLLQNGFAQQYSGAFAINPTDSSFLTASALSASGDVVTSSLVKTKNLPGGTGLPGLLSVGEMVLRKFSPNFSLQWQVDFPGSKARILFVKALDNGDVIISGAYRDTLQFSPTKSFYAEQFRTNAFVARYDNQGSLKWVYVTTPHPNYSKYFITFDVKDDKVYLPFSAFPIGDTKLLVIDDQGDSINNILLADGALLISEFKFDHTGEMYLCGTGDPQALLGGGPIGADSTILGYGTFVGKLDSSFQQIWSDKFSYVTIDLYPRVSFTSNRVAFLVDTLPQPNGIGNYHMLKFYTPSGSAIQSDSIGPGIFSPMHRSMALQSFGKDFIYASVSGFDTITINKVDQQFNHQRLTSIVMNRAQAMPWIITNDSVVYYNHSFLGSFAVVNLSDTVVNLKTGTSAVNSYQQIMVKLTTLSSVGFDESEIPDNLLVYPNPARSVLNVICPHEYHSSSLEVITLDGQVMYRRFKIKENQTSLDVENIPSGLYLVRITQGENSFVKRFIKL